MKYVLVACSIIDQTFQNITVTRHKTVTLRAQFVKLCEITKLQ